MISAATVVFWGAAVLVLAAVLALLLWPLLRRSGGAATRAEYDRAIYRDQLREVDRDLDRGVLSVEEAVAARTEIKRRILGTAKAEDIAETDLRRSPALAVALLVLVSGGTLAIYLQLGAPGTPDQPLAERLTREREERALAGDIESRIDALAERARQDPGNIEQWVLLARSYAFVERHGEAAEAFRRALEIDSERTDILSAYAEALTLANGNRIVPAAHLAFTQVHNADPMDPRARYYLALYEAQQQNFQAAMDAWLALLADSPPDAGWVGLVRRNVIDMAGFLEIEVTTVLPDATPEELAGIAAAPATPASGTATDSVAALEARLAAEPKDYQGWLDLARARAGQGDGASARDALLQVSELYPAAPFVQQQIRRTAAELGVSLDAAASAATPAPRGPSAEDMAAAAEMTTAERTEMIDSMVAGLAARLEERPDDLQGWTMLIRSYTVLGRRDDAAQAVEQALTAFDGRPQAQDSVRQTAAELGLAVD